MSHREEKVERHESFGMVGISRRSIGGGGTNLFGSSIRHHTVFALTVMTCEKVRDLNYDRFHSINQLIEIELSPTQLVDLITSPNIGNGVPCTLSRIGGKRIADCPETNARQQFVDEFDDDVKKATEAGRKLAAEAKEILDKKGTILKSDRERLSGLIDRLIGSVNSHLPFVHRQFNEAMDKTVTEAKGEVEAFFTTKIQSLGIEALQNEVRALLPSIQEAEPPQLEDLRSEQ